MEESAEQMENLVNKCKDLNVPLESLPVVQVYKKLYTCEVRSWSIPKWSLACFIFLIGLYILKHYNLNDECSLTNPGQISLAFRPPEKCIFCKGITEVKRISKISPKDFEELYAYSGIPIIITDVTKNWTAHETFSFDFFKDIYLNSKRKNKALDCQFFPYQSGFDNLFEGLSIPAKRAKLEAGEKPWYFGWSNCQSSTAEILRRHYTKPYFLPRSSENGAVDWIFMGWGGLGAHMHVDNVRLPSWQAQIKGMKKWVLAPPPECYFECSSFDVTVHPGETSVFFFLNVLEVFSYDFFSVILDTNKWYHQTIVIPGEMSISIGAEYD